MITVKTIMTTDVKFVRTETSILDALDLLGKSEVSGLPVVDESNHVVGVLTEKDVLEILIHNNLDVKNKVGDYMTREVICFQEEDNVIDVCKFFIRSHVRRVPIVREGMLVGIVSRHDIVELIIQAKNNLSDITAPETLLP